MRSGKHDVGPSPHASLSKQETKRFLLSLLVLQDWNLMSEHPKAEFPVATYSVPTGLSMYNFDYLIYSIFLHHMERSRESISNEMIMEQELKRNLSASVRCVHAAEHVLIVALPPLLSLMLYFSVWTFSSSFFFVTSSSTVLLCSRSPWAATISSVTWRTYLLPVASF